MHLSLSNANLVTLIETMMKASGGPPFVALLPKAQSLITPYGQTSKQTLQFQDVQDGEGEGVEVSWSSGAIARVGKQCGRLLGWRNKKGTAVLLTPLDTCLYRACTDNDRYSV